MERPMKVRRGLQSPKSRAPSTYGGAAESAQIDPATYPHGELGYLLKHVLFPYYLRMHILRYAQAVHVGVRDGAVVCVLHLVLTPLDTVYPNHDDLCTIRAYLPSLYGYFTQDITRTVHLLTRSFSLIEYFCGRQADLSCVGFLPAKHRLDSVVVDATPNMTYRIRTAKSICRVDLLKRRNVTVDIQRMQISSNYGSRTAHRLPPMISIKTKSLMLTDTTFRILDDTQLTYTNLWTHGVPKESMCKALRTPSGRHLRKLSIGGGDYRDPTFDDHSLAPATNALCSVLTIVAVNIGDSGLIALLSHLPNVVTLSVIGCDFVTVKSLHWISTHALSLRALRWEPNRTWMFPVDAPFWEGVNVRAESKVTHLSMETVALPSSVTGKCDVDILYSYFPNVKHLMFGFSTKVRSALEVKLITCAICQWKRLQTVFQCWRCTPDMELATSSLHDVITMMKRDSDVRLTYRSEIGDRSLCDDPVVKWIRNATRM